MEIRRFGIGHRRAGGPRGSRGVEDLVIHGDARGVVSELAFRRHAALEPHLSPDTGWLVVIEGGGFVQVGDERARVAAGEAVLLPAGVVRSVRTEHSEMRAILVELAGADDSHLRAILEGIAARPALGEPIGHGEGRLASIPGPPGSDPDDGEPI